MDVIVGIDAGTSMIKAVAFDLAGRELAAAGMRNRYDLGPGGAVTQPMERTWQDCLAVLADLSDRLPGLSTRLAAIAVTGQGDGTWLIDAGGRPVGDGWLWLDSRAAAIADRLRMGPDEPARFAATGTGLTACQQGPQLRWMIENLPDALASAATAFHCKDYLFFRLTGMRATDPCEAAMSFGNFRTRRYDETVIAALGLEEHKRLLPPILDGVTTHLPLAGEAARATGLRAGTPVVLGYLDAACTALGAGVREGGRDHGCTIIGSTGVHLLAAAAADVRLATEGSGYVLALPLPGRVALMQTNMAGTINIDWILGLGADLVAELGGPPPDLMARLDGWIRTAVDGPLFHPYTSEAGERGPFVAPHARAAFSGLSVSHGFGHLVGAVCEGMALAARDCHDAMGGVAPEVRLTGGAARSGALRAVYAAVLGSPVRRSLREESGAAGAAMMAAVAVGAYADMEDCIADWVTPRLGPAEPPEPGAAAWYAGRFAAYRDARRAMPPLWDALAALRRAG